MFDDALQMWIARYRWSVEDEQLWDVFDSSGVFLGAVDFPKRFEPLDIRDDKVVGVLRDSSDVDHVQLYSLVRR